MKLFAALLTSLAESSKVNEKIEQIVHYLTDAPPGDRGAALFLLCGGKLPRVISSREMREWVSEETEIPLWLLEESYQVVGDLAETLTLLITTDSDRTLYSLSECVTELGRLRGKGGEERRSFITEFWRNSNRETRFLLHKLLTGGFRIGVSRAVVIKALAKYSGRDEALLAHRLIGRSSPEEFSPEVLFQPEDGPSVTPYPFFLASPLEGAPSELGEISEWQCEWKWDGIRGQLLNRGVGVSLWSRGEELLNESFPEFQALSDLLPKDTVIDGEVVITLGGAIAPFSVLQKRITRRKITQKILNDLPAQFLAYDLLELGGADLRSSPLVERRRRLEQLIQGSSLLQVSPLVSCSSWDELQTLRSKAPTIPAEGVMIKRLSSPYRSGRRRGDWWKWKIDPFTVDGVLVYAQKGHGRRADIYSDYTFAVWGEDGQLVPFAKAYSGLTDEEMKEVDSFIKENIKERFGPVRTVNPVLVFEIAFDGIQQSKRHRSGVALRFPRIKRFRRDKPAAEADSLATLIALMRTST